jgi:signal transduction histidine kinase/streptogramin lyase
MRFIYSILIAIILQFALVYYAYCQSNTLDFERFSSDDGLSADFVNCIEQDSLGFLWIGTNDGINRFDGYTFKTIRSIGQKGKVVSGNQINSIVYSNPNVLWIATNNGLNCMYLETGNIEHFALKSPGNSNNSISKLVVDGKGLVWFSFAYDSFINCYDPHSKRVKSIKLHNPINNLPTIPKDFLYSKTGRIIIGGSTGNIIQIDAAKQVIVKNITIDASFEMSQLYEDSKEGIWASSNAWGYYHIPDPFTNASSSVYYNYFPSRSFIEVDDTTMLIGSIRHGVFEYNTRQRVFTQHYIEKPGNYLANKAGVVCFYKDRYSNIWIGSNGYGLFMIPKFNNPFHTLTQQYIPTRITTKNNGITHNTYTASKDLNMMTMKSVRCLYADKEYIWFGGYPGLNKIHRITNKITVIDSTHIVYCIKPDPIDPNTIWIGCEEPMNSLYRYSKITNKLSQELLHTGYIFSLVCDSANSIWMGTQTGLIHYNPSTKHSRSYKNTGNGGNQLPPGELKSLLKSKDGKLWIGTSVGKLASLNPRTGEFSNYPENDASSTFAKDYILCIYEQFPILWIGTGSGLYKYNTENNNITIYTSEDGLPNNVIYGIVPDKNGNLWLSTNKGICCFNPLEITCVNYGKANGLQANEFNTSAYYSTPNNEIFFGGINGFTWFNPNQIKNTPLKANIALTNVSINNNSIEDLNPYTTNHHFKFSYKDVFVTIEFAATSLINSDKIKYKYKLEGIDNHWVELGSESKVTFNSLPTDNFRLIITAYNDHLGQAPVPLVITIEVIPPFYKKAWFYVIIILIVSFVTWFLINKRIKSIKKSNVHLAELVEQRTSRIKEQNQEILLQKEQLQISNENLETLNATKDKFFSIIGHDLKNPLGVVMGFSELLLTEFAEFNDEQKQQYIKIINEASNSAYSLLENLLTWSRSQTGKIAFNPEMKSLSAIIFDELGKASTLATQKKIRVIPNISDEYEGYFDENMFRTIIRNLLMNAIKFSNSNGIIEVRVLPLQDYYEILVSDTGIGMDKDVMDSLFNIGVSQSRVGTNNEKGTGLGLILSQEFIKRNGGTLSVQSVVGVGSTFRFTVLKQKMDGSIN